MSCPIEIERKFVIEKPDIARLSEHSGYSVSAIEQTYLASEPAVTRRVRARNYGDKTVYTETKKVRIDGMSAFEDEREISESEYMELLSEIMPGTRTLSKTRHTLEYSGRTLEIDVYPDWERTCILEVELDSRSAKVELPHFIRVVAEVTGDKRYSNASMSCSFPEELI